jgi:hypothetical protein
LECLLESRPGWGGHPSVEVRKREGEDTLAPASDIKPSLAARCRSPSK